MRRAGVETDRDRSILAFLRACRDALDGADRSLVSDSVVRGGFEAFSSALDHSMPLDFEPSSLPVLETVADLEGTHLALRLVDLAADLPWVPTLRAEDGGTDFGLAQLDSTRDFGDLVVGLMYVGPERQYPLHHHSPQELYLTIGGEGRWRFGGDDDFRPIGPGSILYNHPNDLHSVVAGPAPLAALYVLWPESGE